MGSDLFIGVIIGIITTWLIARGARKFSRGLTALGAGWATAVFAVIVAVVPLEVIRPGVVWSFGAKSTGAS